MEEFNSKRTNEDGAQGQGSLKATITKTETWDPIQEAIEKAPPGSCVVFDIDGVIVDQGTHEKLVDSAILSVVELIKSKKLKAYALTHSAWGASGRYERMRFDTLKGLGIDFSALSQYKNSLQIPWVLEGSDKTALLHDGIIFARDGIKVDLPKGPIFFEVLGKLKEQPTQVIFIDDKEDSLESMEEECQKHRIPFLGFRYLGDKSSDSSWFF